MVVQREVQASSCLCSLLILPSAVSFQRRSRNARISARGAAALFAQDNCGSLITPRAPALSCHGQHWQPRSVLLGQSKLPAASASAVFGFAASQALGTGPQPSLMFCAVTSGEMGVFWWAGLEHGHGATLILPPLPTERRTCLGASKPQSWCCSAETPFRILHHDNALLDKCFLNPTDR